MRKILLAGLLLFSTALFLYAQEGDFGVLSDWKNHNDRWVERQDGGYMLFRRLNERAFELLDERDREIATIKTAAGWEQRRRYVRRALNELLGPWPRKTPLNADVRGVLERDRYRVEKLVYESQPGLHVTAALYIPNDTTKPKPGILYIPGHADNGFRAGHYQNACLNLVHKGFVVLAYDPIGQGERQQEIDPATGAQLVNHRELPFYKKHSYVGNQLFLSGVSISRYFIWDAIRGIDYLISRPEVDGSRIGVTGNSGGGNLSVYTAAIDDRVTVSVPSCYVTSYRRMLEINGVQDAEQNVYHALKRGIEHADWLLARAPNPTLLLTTTHDFFPIQGARETEAAVRRIYKSMGEPDHFGRAEDDHGHGYTRKNNEASYAFLMKHLGVEGSAAEEKYPGLSAEQLQVTESGQVVTQFGAETVFSLNRTESERLLVRLGKARARDRFVERAVEKAKELSGYRGITAPDDAIFRGGFPRDGYRIEKFALDGGPNSVIPLLLATPNGEGPFPAVVYLHPDGKTAGIAPGGTVEKLTREGFAVVAADVIDTGETAARIGRQNDTNAGYYEGALIGSSVVGLQAEDIVRVVAWLQGNSKVRADRIGLAATGTIGPAALHAAAFSPEIRWLALDGAPATYASVVMNQMYKVPSTAMVAGALSAYDLPDLVVAMAPRKTFLLGATDEKLQPLGEGTLKEVYGESGGRLRVAAGGEATLIEAVKWCAE